MKPDQQTDRSDGTQTVQPSAFEFKGIVQSLTKSADLIEALRTGAKYKTELADELGVSKSTVYNWLTELKEYGFVELSENGFQLTTTGRLQAELYREIHDASRQVHRATDILREIPPAHAPPTAVLTDEPLTVRMSNQYELIHEFVEIVRGATRITGLCPMLCEPLLSAIADGLESRDLQLELILSETAHQTLLDYHATHGRVLATAANSDIRASRHPLPLGLAVVDGRAYILGMHSETVFVGYVTTESTAAVDWAHDHIEMFRSQATPVTPNS